MKTSFSRIFITASIILILTLVLIGISFQILVKNYLTDTAVDRLKSDGQCIADLVEAYSSEGTVSSRDFHIALSATATVSGADAVVCDAQGQILLCADSPLGCEHVGWQLDQSFLQRTFSEDGCSYTGAIRQLYPDTRYVVSLPIYSDSGQRLGIVIISSPVDTTATVLQRISNIFLSVSVLVVLVSVVLTTYFSRRNTAPLRAMAKAASAFGHGDFSARVASGGKYPEDVEELALAFNNMASSLQKSEYQRQEFIANVSHELKTPMTTISGYVDGILDGTIPEDRSRHYLAMVSDETKRLSRLVRSMLNISRLQDQGGIPSEQKNRFEVPECAGQVLISFEQQILSKSLDVEVDFPEHPVFTFANEDYITQVLYNLVDNAVKFCPEGGQLSLSIREGGGKVYTSICNSGQTIPPEELPLVFDRFHKTDKSRSRHQDGDSWGLGLYIVKTIICSHGEDISVTSRDGQTTFTFTLPLVN